MFSLFQQITVKIDDGGDGDDDSEDEDDDGGFMRINKDGLQMGMSSDFILCNILRLSFLLLQHSEAERWRETGSVYLSRQ